jgi:hypothetical protein
LQDSHEVSAETKEKVWALAKKLNYEPNPYASSLRRQKSKTNLVFRAEFSYFSMKFDGSGTVSNNSFTKKANYKLKVNTVSPAVSVLYNVLNSPKNKIYVGVGVAGNISSYPENIYSDVPESIGQPYEKSPYFFLEKFWLSTHAKAGWILNKKIELAATTKLDGAFSNFTASSVSASISSLSINYHFN